MHWKGLFHQSENDFANNNRRIFAKSKLCHNLLSRQIEASALLGWRETAIAAFIMKNLRGGIFKES